jgi:hypothetical protein
MANVWDWFDKIYCGTVASSTERRHTMAHQFSELGMRVHWIVGEQAETPEQRHLATTDNHLTAYRDALKNGYKKVLVMEDDCEFLNISTLQNSLDELDDLRYWDICYLGAYLYGHTIEISKANLLRVTKAVWLTGYVISDRLMARLLEPSFLEIYKTKPLDLVIHELVLPLGGGYVCRPMVCKQRACYSDISEKVEDYDDMFRDSLRWMK